MEFGWTNKFRIFELVNLEIIKKFPKKRQMD